MSSISSGGVIQSNRQIRAVGATGVRNRIIYTGQPELTLNISDGPFLYIDCAGQANVNFILKCNQFYFGDQMFLQISNGTGTPGIINFSTGFSVTNPQLQISSNIVSFICDGYHMLELSRSNWWYNY